jgi:dethiobiotin synthetase/adenosylmethionine--8-amino-7-oxononanoate aminotransferase
MAGKAGDVLWWPFTQHGLVGTENVTVIDSRTGDEFAVYSGSSHLESSSRSASGDPSASTSKPTSETQKETSVKKEPAGFDPSSLDASPIPPNRGAGFLNPETLNPSFDACASWWTQGVSLEGQLEITRAMAYAAGRYGHVMFPENVHEPALRLAEKLLGGVGKGEDLRV